MPSTSRRAVLHAAAAGALGLSGCSAFGEDSEPVVPRLIDLVVLSFHTEPHTFHVRLELDGETVYEDARAVEAASPDEEEGAGFDGYPEEREPYELSVWLDDDESTTRTLEFADYDAECLAVNAFYGRYEEPPENATLRLYTATNCRAEE